MIEAALLVGVLWLIFGLIDVVRCINKRDAMRQQKLDDMHREIDDLSRRENHD